MIHFEPTSSTILSPRFRRALNVGLIHAAVVAVILFSGAFCIPHSKRAGTGGLDYFGFVKVVLIATTPICILLGADYLLRRRQRWLAGPDGIEFCKGGIIVRHLSWEQISSIDVLPFSLTIRTCTKPYSERLYWTDPTEARRLKQLWENGKN